MQELLHLANSLWLYRERLLIWFWRDQTVENFSQGNLAQYIYHCNSIDLIFVYTIEVASSTQ